MAVSERATRLLIEPQGSRSTQRSRNESRLTANRTFNIIEAMKKAVPYVVVFIGLMWVDLWFCLYPRDYFSYFSTSRCVLESVFSTCTIAAASIPVLLFRKQGLPKAQNVRNILCCVLLPSIVLTWLALLSQLAVHCLNMGAPIRSFGFGSQRGALIFAGVLCIISAVTLVLDHWLRLLRRKSRAAVWIVIFLSMPVFFDQAFSRDDVHSSRFERCDECGSERVIEHGRFHRFFYYEEGEETFITKEGANFEKCQHNWDRTKMRTY